MPRANIDQHLPEQSKQTGKLLILPEVKRIREAIRAARDERPDRRITASTLAKILHVSADQLKANIPWKPSHHGARAATISQSAAERALREFLPITLKWRKAVDVARDNGLHRNQVERIIRFFGDRSMLLYARDQKLYVSHAGERLVKQKRKELDGFGDRKFIPQVALEYKLPINCVTAYFSNRRIKIERDPLGRARLTHEQASEFAEWRELVSKRKSHADIDINGERYRSIIRVAREKAALLHPPKSVGFREAAQREEHVLRLFTQRSGTSVPTALGTYLPARISTNFILSLTLKQAARIANVSETTIKSWRAKDQRLLAPEVPGRRTIGVSLLGLRAKIEEKYQSEPKLKKGGVIPSLHTSLICKQIADELGTDFETVAYLISYAPLSSSGEGGASIPGGKDYKQVTKALISRTGLVPLKWHREITNALPNYLQKVSPTPPDSPSPLLCLTLADIFGAQKAIISGDAAAAYVKSVGAARDKDPEKIYKFARKLLQMGDAWPESYNQLRLRALHGFEISNYPLTFGALMALLLNKDAKVYEERNLRSPPKRGDIFICSNLSDFGEIKKVQVSGQQIIILAKMVKQRRTAEFSLEPCLRDTKQGAGKL